MSNSRSSQGYKRFYPILKWIFSGLSVYFFIIQVKGLEENFFSNLSVVFAENKLLVILTLILAFLNWTGESLKFSLLIKSEIVLKRFKALLIIFSGMAISNFTPARTGEYIGRGLMLKMVHPLKLVVATITGNITQVMMTYGLGLLSIGYLTLFTDFAGVQQGRELIFVAVAFALVIVAILSANRWISFLKKRLPDALARPLRLIKNYDRSLFSKVLGLAFLRYLSFSIQFFLLLQIFSGFQLSIGAIVLIPSAYLLQSIVPVPAITDIGVRVAVSQFLFGDTLSNQVILQAVSTLWFTNLIIPGIIGTLYIIFSNLKERWY